MWYVFHRHGDCNDGSHSCGLTEHDTWEAAFEAVKALVPAVRSEGGGIKVINGELAYVYDGLLDVVLDDMSKRPL